MGNLTDPPDALYTLDEEDPGRPPRDERPVDLRDEVESEADDMRPGDPDATFMGASETPPMGPYPPPPMTERPHLARSAGTPQPTLDPSHSRPVDRAAAGIDVEDSGYEPEG